MIKDVEREMRKQTKLFDFFYPRIIKIYQGGQVVPVESKHFLRALNK